MLTSNREKNRTAAHLFPSALPKRVSLIQGIQQLVLSVNTHCAFHADLVHSGLEQAVIEEPFRSAVYRVVKAQIKNILRQGRATTATVHLAKNLEQLAIVVEDNDAGADLSKMKNSRSLKAIQKVVEQHKGKLNFFAEEGGTVLQVLISMTEA